MSSTEYAELAGLRIALSNLKLVEESQQTIDWISVTNWMLKRINELTKK